MYEGQKKNYRKDGLNSQKMGGKLGGCWCSGGLKKKFKNLPLQVSPQTRCIVMDVSNIFWYCNTVTINYVHSLILNKVALNEWMNFLWGSAMVPGPGGVGRGHHTNNQISLREKKIRLTKKNKTKIIELYPLPEFTSRGK